MPGTGDALHGSEWRYPHLDSPPGHLVSKNAQAVPDGRPQRSPDRLRARCPGCFHGRQARRAECALGRDPAPRRLAERGPLLVEGGEQPSEVRTARWHGYVG